MENASEVVPPQVTDPLPQVMISVDWADAASVQPQHVNQVMAQLGNPTPDGTPDGIYIGWGSVPPPIVVAPNPEELQKRLEAMQGSIVKVDVVGRFHMSRGLLSAVIQVLQTVADQYDTTVRQAEERNSPGQR